MARFFNSEQIDYYRDCFNLCNFKSSTITEVDQLMFVMRSTGLSPTIDELQGYLKQKGNVISFGDFLDCAHSHQKVERLPDEILAAFKSSPWIDKNGHISASDLKHVLCDWGEKLSAKEADALLKENNLTRSNIDYKQLVNALVIPKSDNN